MYLYPVSPTPTPMGASVATGLMPPLLPAPVVTQMISVMTKHQVITFGDHPPSLYLSLASWKR